MSNNLLAEPATLTGTAYYCERIALPPNAVFTATLEDVSLMDVASVVLGSVSLDPAGSPPFAYIIAYDTEALKPGHRYNIRAKITVDGQLLFTSDTIHPVLSAESSAEPNVRMIKVKRYPRSSQQYLVYSCVNSSGDRVLGRGCS
ncbi:YbaY family lipoprotein [Bathymodiolus japonicus methanotrophic gill symbiont]|uniref:YbaY family lipoprotein n=1 Tax=Bathymodiolus japonicus methanotrophic gill symbiont TaxID=113269 RepID=UPI003B833536